jgi:endonuclease NucS-like protein
MLERDMELAVASCPDLFIEPGLTLVRRQVVINNRRPDVLFTDNLSRHLLVEIQKGRLDEDHLQRHFYYFFDYRAKYHSTHLRLMFIANRLVPQHKEFLDEHGYEYREYPEGEFERRAHDCSALDSRNDTHVQIFETPGVLPASTHEILYEIETHKMTLCYKMLVLMYMAELVDSSGGVALRVLAEKFQEFFIDRSLRNKAEENPRLVDTGTLSLRKISTWERVIRDEPVRRLTQQFVVDNGASITWAPRIWSQWNAGLQNEIRRAAFDRLVRYFDRNVPGGY